ncbi:MAG: hypothetical protein ABGY72_04170 [bacterium]
MRQALQTVARRVNELGVSEPIVARHGAAGDQILVQLPGVEDVAEAKAVIRSMGRLDITLIEEGPAPTRDRLLATRNGVVPADTEVVAGLVAVALFMLAYYRLSGVNAVVVVTLNLLLLVGCLAALGRVQGSS